MDTWTCYGALGAVTQLEEYLVCNQAVGSSSLPCSTRPAAQQRARVLAEIRHLPRASMTIPNLRSDRPAHDHRTPPLPVWRGFFHVWGSLLLYTLFVAGFRLPGKDVVCWHNEQHALPSPAQRRAFQADSAFGC